MEEKNEAEISDQNTPQSNAEPLKIWQSLLIGAIAGYSFLLCCMTLYLGSGLLDFSTWLEALWGLVFGALGAVVGRSFGKTETTAVLGALVGVIVGIACFLYLILSRSIGF